MNWVSEISEFVPDLSYVRCGKKGERRRGGEREKANEEEERKKAKEVGERKR